MYKTLVIARHTTHQALRQPLFYILTASFAAMIWASQFFTMFTLDERLEGVLLREMGIASIALCCATQAVLMSWLVITRDMERLTALTVLSKPVGRTQFLVGKYLGILCALLFASAILGSTLFVTLWQKEGSTSFETLSAATDAGLPDFTPDVSAKIVSVQPIPVDRPVRARVELDRALPEPQSRLADRAGRPAGGRYALGILSTWNDNRSLQYRIESSINQDGRTVLTVLVPWEWRDADGKPLSTTSAGPILPPSGTEARVSTSRLGAAQLHYSRFWTFEAAQIAKAALLATMRVAILLAFATAMAPHVSLVVNASISFLLFLLGHVSNSIHLALDSSASGFLRFLGRIFYLVFPNLENSRVESLVSVGREISSTYVLWSAGYGLAYAALVLVLGAVIFSRKEIR